MVRCAICFNPFTNGTVGHENCLEIEERGKGEKAGVKGDSIKPDHYAVGGIEPIDYMKVKMSKEAFNGFLLGNVIKYTSRFEHKNGLEDLKKAQWYLNKLVSENES